jgi:hypothetical protein
LAILCLLPEKPYKTMISNIQVLISTQLKSIDNLHNELIQQIIIYWSTSYNHVLVNKHLNVYNKCAENLSQMSQILQNKIHIVIVLGCKRFNHFNHLFISLNIHNWLKYQSRVERKWRKWLPYINGAEKC